MKKSIVRVYKKGSQIHCWEFETPTFYDLQQGFLKRFGNIVSDYPRMYMKNRVYKSTDISKFQCRLVVIRE